MRSVIRPGRRQSAGVLALAVTLLCFAAACRKNKAGDTPPGDRPLDVSSLPEVKHLPDPFRMKDGRRALTPRDWIRRKEEMRSSLQRYQYGAPPPPPANLKARVISSEATFGGKAVRRRVELSFGPDRRLKTHVGLLVPRGKGPFPVVVHIDHRETFGVPTADEIVARGYILAGQDPNYLAPDQKGMVGPAQAAYPDSDWATLAVWAWGASRALDYLLTLKAVDRRRTIVTGHSRSGKAALLAGALDERFALVAPQGSGCGGAAAYRFGGAGVETLDRITRSFPHWFVPRFRGFAGKEGRLPFDQHFLHALVAPRALLTIDALGDRWANPPGTQLAHLAARQVYAFHGAGDRLGIHFREGKHELSAADWRTLLDFADRLFFDRSPPGGRRFDRLPFPTREKAFSWRSPPASPAR